MRFCTMSHSITFASLLCSRLCHDLVSPVGALTNGVELLGDETDADMRAQCLQLLADSARVCSDRLKFFRLAFGAAGGYGDRVDLREVKNAIEGLYNSERTKVIWDVSATSLSKPCVKVLLNLALLVGDALLRGGNLTIQADETQEGTLITLQGEGPRTLLAEDLRQALAGHIDVDALDPRAAPAFLVYQLVHAAQGTIHLSAPDQAILWARAVLPIPAA
jgi:histidine phosphotransferase ChpT